MAFLSFKSFYQLGSGYNKNAQSWWNTEDIFQNYKNILNTQQ